MRNELNQRLNEVLKGLDPKTVNEGKRTAERFLSTPEGKELVKKLSSADKDKLISSFMSMSTEDIKAGLKGSDISGINAESISRLLNKH